MSVAKQTTFLKVAQKILVADIIRKDILLPFVLTKPKRESCKTCNQSDHTHRQYLQNYCRGYSKIGYLEIDCPVKELKQQNLTLACGYNRQTIEERRSQYYSYRRVFHCCE